jgi:hypothetical protein
MYEAYVFRTAEGELFVVTDAPDLAVAKERVADECPEAKYFGKAEVLSVNDATEKD